MNLSVIIPAHGRKDHLIRCLRSLDTDRQGNLDYSACVIDDGSALDEEFVRKNAGVHYSLLWRAFPSNRGRGAARNEGIHSTSGDIVVFMDSDMEAQSGFLEAHLRCHEEQPQTAVIGRINWPERGGFIRYIGTRGVRKLAPGQTVPPWYFVTGNSSVRRSDLPGEKPFDEKLAGWGGEDQDLGMRLSNDGISFMYAPEAQTYHHFEGTIAQHIQRTFLYGRDILPVLIERYPELREAVKLDVSGTLHGRLLVSDAVFYPMTALARLCDILPLPSKLYDYLTFAAYCRGWKKGKRL